MTTDVWNLDLPATPNDIDAEIADYGLCNLVRGQYLKRLRETLAQNLGALIPGCRVDQQIDSYIDKCMAEMEKIAIRNCMVANLYCRGMMHMINDVKNSTANGSMHDALKAVIVSANSGLRDGDATVSVDHEISHTNNVESSGDVSATFPENHRHTDEVDIAPDRIGTEASYPAQPTFDVLHDEKRMFAMAVEKYRRTGIRQRSAIPAACMEPSTMRPKIVDAVAANPVDSDRVAETHEFRGRLREMPDESRLRVDGMLDRFFATAAAAADGTQHAFRLSEQEEQAVCRKRIARMVVGRMKPYYDAGRVTRTMFKALAELITKNFTYHTHNPSEETVANTVDKFFSDNTKYICRFEDFNSHFLQQ